MLYRLIRALLCSYSCLSRVFPGVGLKINVQLLTFGHSEICHILVGNFFSFVAFALAIPFCSLPQATTPITRTKPRSPNKLPTRRGLM